MYKVCFAIQICRVVCCGESNFQQHLNSKRHLRRAAHAGTSALNAQMEASADGSQAQEPLNSSNPTYMGLQAQCRNYCKQVIHLHCHLW